MMQAPGARRRGEPLHVLVVDDSAVVRQIVAAILSQDPGIAVTVAADPLIAARKIAERRPDVMLLDLEMPRMDGLTFLRRVMADDPLPVVIVSAHTEQGAATSMRALESGAVAIVTKPKIGVRSFLEESATLLLDAVHSAAQARVGRRVPTSAPIGPAARKAPSPFDLIAIGASIGGPEALCYLLGQLPAEMPGIVVVQHMPALYTAAFARRLHEVSRLVVMEARDGDEVKPGHVLVAPGDQHMRVQRGGTRYRVGLDDGPPVSRHRPSVDVLFDSVAKTVGRRALGVLLTGMGDDGAAGLLAMRNTGAETIAQDASSCVVFGMPKAAIDRGAARQIVPLARMPDAILRREP